MTTIACNHKMMAADSQTCDGGISGKAVKIFRVNDDIIGFAGSLGQGMKFVAWYGDRNKEAPSLSDSNILILKHDGSIEQWDESMMPLVVKDKFYAIGSGSHFAMGAMYAGKNPKQSVEIAIKLDVDSGGPVKVLEL